MWLPRLQIAAVTACVIFAAGSLLYAYNKGRQSGMSAIQTRWDAERARTAEAHALELAKARTREQILQAQAAQLREDHRRETIRISGAYSAVIDSLRDRPETRAGASGVPEAASPGAGCTGAGLARPDAGFLAGYAADAARLAAALNQCRAAYDSIMKD